MVEKGLGQGQLETKKNLSADASSASADIVVSERFRGLIRKKARQVSELVRANVNKALFTAAGVGIILSSGCGNTENSSISNTPIPIHASAETHGYNWKDMSEGVKVAFDKEGLPVEFKLIDGTNGVFDREEVKRIKKKAIVSKEPEIISQVIQVFGTSDPDYTKPSYSKEHPKVTELPDDVLSNEELKKRGVTIFQAPNTKFYIRENAFAEGGILAGFNSTGRNLTIVLSNGNTTGTYLDNASYAESIGKLNSRNKEIPPMKEKKIKYLKQKLESLRQDKEGDSRLGTDHNDDILYTKMIIEEYRTLNDERVIEDYTDEIYSGDMVLGRYKRGYDPTIFISVQEQGDYYIRAFYFDPKGVFATDLLHIGYGLEFPKDFPTHPNPKDFKLNSEVFSDNRSKVYDYEMYAPGFTVRHEFKHDELIQGKIDKGEKPNESEQEADIRAMQGIQLAWEKWEKSGFTDNSGYDFVFSLSKGGYILTENKSSSDSASPDKL